MSRGRCRGGGGWKGNGRRVRGIGERIVVLCTSFPRVFADGETFEEKRKLNTL